MWHESRKSVEHCLQRKITHKIGATHLLVGVYVDVCFLIEMRPNQSNQPTNNTQKRIYTLSRSVARYRSLIRTRVPPSRTYLHSHTHTVEKSSREKHNIFGIYRRPKCYVYTYAALLLPFKWCMHGEWWSRMWRRRQQLERYTCSTLRLSALHTTTIRAIAT